ncbi:MAG TPA: RNA polymerase sigma factor [Bacteroidales bacterium]|nr:RNA polymerase sigma factor [Bacteroidales bacterium]
MTEKDININERLIDKCLEGDIKAQFLLYKQYSKAMYNIAVRFLANKMDAEDILQESFVSAFERLEELINRKAFGSWLKTIVINNCISFLRKQKVQFEDIREFNLEEEEKQELDLTLDPTIVHSAIKDLPEGSRTVLVLHALEGYRHREIADMLNISESTSKTQYRRALGLLNKKLKHKVYVN